MVQLSRPRRGSLQYWPRKRARKVLPSVNWTALKNKNQNKLLLGFIGYKVGMKSSYVKDNTQDSMTKGKRIIVPCTIIECPPIKILSIRFYKNSRVILDIISSDLDKNIKRKIKLPKNIKETSGKSYEETVDKKINDIKEFDNVSIIAYVNVSKSGIKKNPDIFEIGLSGNKEEKLSFIKEHLKKEIRVSETFKVGQLIDIRGVTKGKGLQGPVKRFGIGLKQHKSEKGVRRPGSLGPWHPARVTFRVPMAGQVGFFTRVVYNTKLININDINEKNINSMSGFKNYGAIKTDYVIVIGSVQGPSKRQLILTHPLRATKKQSKKQYEFLGIR